MSYSIDVCAVKHYADRYVWVDVGTEDEVVSRMADEQDKTPEYIRDNYEIEEESIDIPYELQRKIIRDHEIMQIPEISI